MEKAASHATPDRTGWCMVGASTGLDTTQRVPATALCAPAGGAAAPADELRSQEG